MKIAAISMTMNDDFRLSAWKSYYDEYKDEISEHIIVDNGSTQEYQDLLHDTFPTSTIIELGYNGGCTGAYNAGIRKALTNPIIDAILLIGNDVRIEKGGLTKLYGILFSNPEYGMIAPVLLKKDSQIIECFGSTLNLKNGDAKGIYSKQPITEIGKKTMEVGLVPGGANLSKRIFYEPEGVGLQDENLFMYCDERDMALRAKKKGYLTIATSEALSWHQHIDRIGNLRDPRTEYLRARNYIYVANKHFSKKTKYIELIMRLTRQTALYFRDIRIKERRIQYYYYLKGVVAGLRNNMDNSLMGHSVK